MKLYVLCSYGDGLNDPQVSTDYPELYEKMAKSYRMTLDHSSQTEEEREDTYLSAYSARAVIHGDWMEWSITELELPERAECFAPVKDNPYPLCIGKDMGQCKECQLRADWEPDDPYGVGA